MRVLVVEDELELAAYLKKGLEREGHAVDVVNDGEEAVWMADSQTFDAIVLDIMLPKKNGYQVCSELRGRDNWVPVLMLTAKDGEHDIAEALDTGADDYLTKPFSFTVLTARLRAITRRGAAERPAVLQTGPVTLDPARHRVEVGGEEVSLTATEFCIFQLLMRRSGEVVSKAEILEGCWDWAFDGDPNIVEVYIRYLRRKIDDTHDIEVIKTVRGAGYVIDS